MPRLRLNRNQPAAHALPQRYEKTGAQINLAIKKLAANISPFATSWCGRQDLNLHAEAMAPKTIVSAIPPRPQILAAKTAIFSLFSLFYLKRIFRDEMNVKSFSTLPRLISIYRDDKPLRNADIYIPHFDVYAYLWAEVALFHSLGKSPLLAESAVLPFALSNLYLWPYNSQAIIHGSGSNYDRHARKTNFAKRNLPQPPDMTQ